MALRLALSAALIYLSIIPPSIYSIDGNAMFALAKSIALDHSLVVPPDFGRLGRQGLYYCPWYPLLSVLAVPFVKLAAFFAGRLHCPIHFAATTAVHLLQVLLTASTVGYVWLLARRLGASKAVSFRAALLFGFCSPALIHAKSFYSEPLMAFLIMSSLVHILGNSRRGVWVACLASGLAVLAKPSTLYMGPLLTFYLWRRKEPFSEMLRPVLGTLMGLGIYLMYNQYRFEHPLIFGHMSYFGLRTAPEAVFGIFASPGYGLLWFSPALVIGFLALLRKWKNHEPDSELLFHMCLGVIGFCALWSARLAWTGGWSWGPRLLAPAFPIMAVGTVFLPVPWKKIIVGLSLWGCLMQIPAALVFFEVTYADSEARGKTAQDFTWDPSESPAFRIWPKSREVIGQAIQLSGDEMRQAFKQENHDSLTTRILGTWWWVVPLVGIPRGVGVMMALLFLLSGLGYLWFLHRSIISSTSLS